MQGMGAILVRIKSTKPKFRRREIEREETYAEGLSAISQNQLLPRSGTVIVRTSATLARLIPVQTVRSAAWFRLGTIFPSNLNTEGQWDEKKDSSFTCSASIRERINFSMHIVSFGVTYVMVSPLSTATKLLRVKKERISPATWFGALSSPPSFIKVLCTIWIDSKQGETRN